MGGLRQAHPGLLSVTAPSAHGGRGRALLLALAAVGALVALGAVGVLLWQGRPRPPRGVILVSIDTLRADRLGCYGYARPTSPFLDRLCAEGVVFENASAPASWTIPSHASLLTGLYPRSHGLRRQRDRLPADVETLADMLWAEGFATGAVVNVPLLNERGFERGFESYTYVRPATDDKGAADTINSLALSWLFRHRTERFFLFLHYYDVHSDYRALPRYRRMLVKPYQGPFRGRTSELRQVRRRELALGEADARHLSDLYDAGIRQLDDSLGKLFRALQRAGALGEILVIVTSDHGEEFLEHGDVLHGRTLYQELVRVPLIFWGHGVPRGRRVDAPVSLVDVLPTVRSLLGIASPLRVEGVDLSRHWSRWGRRREERPLFFEADEWIGNRDNNLRRAIQRGSHKLHYDAHADRVELYDLESDPGEHADLAGRDGERTAALRAELGSFMESERAAERRGDLSPEEAEQLRELGYLE